MNLDELIIMLERIRDSKKQRKKRAGTCEVLVVDTHANVVSVVGYKEHPGGTIVLEVEV